METTSGIERGIYKLAHKLVSLHPECRQVLDMSAWLEDKATQYSKAYEITRRTNLHQKSSDSFTIVFDLFGIHVTLSKYKDLVCRAIMEILRNSNG